MRALAAILALLPGCGAYYEIGKPTPLMFSDVRWADDAMDGAVGFWSHHGIAFNEGDPSGYRLMVTPLPPDRIGQCGNEAIEIAPSLAGKEQETRCVIAHELGHLIGMNHVPQSESLMAPIVALPPDHAACWWSERDQLELEAALKRGISACPG